MPTYESDVCIIGGGLCSAMLAEKLSDLRPGLAITVVEAGSSLFDFGNRIKYRQRVLDYGESAWPGDVLEDQAGAEGMVCLTMAVGGQALRWGSAANRFSEEDLRLKSMYGLAVDWPLSWAEMEKAYCEAERRLNVCGEPSPFPGDKRSEPYPQPPMPLSYNLQTLRTWAEKSGIPFTIKPQAKNHVSPTPDGRGVCCACSTCTEVCPTGARYSPDFTFKRLIAQKKITLHDRTLVRKLVLDEQRPVVVAAQAAHRDRPEQPVEYRARTFVVASGYAWSPHLLLVSACSRFPNGLANSAGLVGKYMNGHKFISAQIAIDVQLYPGQNMAHSLISRRFFRCPTDRPYVRHDTRVWESAVSRTPRLKGEGGRVIMGETLLEDWRQRTKGGTARVRAYYDAHPDRESRLILHPTARNKWGDPLLKIEHRLDAATLAREAATKDHILGVFNLLAKADGGKVLSTSDGDYLDHPGGGCRMGTDPAASVCDSYGRTYDHENLFVVGAPTVPTAGCTNGALTFVALALRSGDRIAADFAKRT